jgi:pimeloyl-ACP methyl ester carboxylesterase
MKFLLIAACSVLVLLVLAGAFLYTPDESRPALEAKYHLSPDGYIEVDGIKLFVVDSGPRDAPCVVMLHGFGSSLQTFDAWAAGLSSNYRVIRLDLPGFGLTGADPTGDYSDARTMKLLSGLLDTLHVAKASFIGNSMGGRFAWEFAANDPGRVDKLILISPDGFASTGFEYGKAPAVPLMLRALPYTMPKAMLKQTLVPAYADPKRLSDATVTRYYDFMRAPGVRQAVIDRTAQTVLEDPVPLLRKIKAPTLLLWGEKDAMIPVSNAADYLAAIPNSKLVELPDLGHVPQEEAPEPTLNIVRKFLAS